MKNKDKIFETMKDFHCWVNIKTIYEKLEKKIDKTTVYRNINKLLLDNYIIEDFDISWEKIYSIKNKHHHHFICDNCHIKINIGCFLPEYIQKIEEKENVKIKNHSFILNGLCKNCK